MESTETVLLSEPVNYVEVCGDTDELSWSHFAHVQNELPFLFLPHAWFVLHSADTEEWFLISQTNFSPDFQEPLWFSVCELFVFFFSGGGVGVGARGRGEFSFLLISTISQMPTMPPNGNICRTCSLNVTVPILFFWGRRRDKSDINNSEDISPQWWWW